MAGTTPLADGQARSKPKKAVKKPAQAQDLATFARQVLTGLGMPVTPANVAFITAWANREGGGGSFNPLNTTLRLPGSSPLPGNSAGVQNFTSFAQGVKATIQTLQSNNYADIRAAFHTGNANPNGTYDGLGTWSGGGYTTLSGVSSANRPVQSHTLSNSAQSGTYTGNTATTTNDSVTEYADSNYGYLGAFLHDPIVGPIIRQAAANNWDNAKLLGALYKTPWWQHTSDTARQFDAEAKLDLAAHNQKVANQQAQITAQAQADGFAIDPARAHKLAVDSLRLGWSDQQLKTGIASEYKYNPNSPTGQNATVSMLKQDAYNYAVPLSDTAIQTWAVKIMSGTATTDDFKAYAQSQAKSLYPTISSALDGVDTQTYFDPYKQVAAQELGVTPDSINLLDPKWQKAIMQQNPDGTRVPMTLDQWRTTLRSDPTYGYGTTPEAANAAASTAHDLLSAMGI